MLLIWRASAFTAGGERLAHQAPCAEPRYRNTCTCRPCTLVLASAASRRRLPLLPWACERPDDIRRRGLPVRPESALGIPMRGIAPRKPISIVSAREYATSRDRPYFRRERQLVRPSARTFIVRAAYGAYHA